MPCRKEGLYTYYQEKDVLPTYARFSCIEDLNRYKGQREQFFVEKLYLPTQMFKNADLIEFGPDSGENSLVFADWGASITLVEPNPKAWPYISDYFENFNFKERLVSIEKVALEAFKTEKQFQIIDAEGFIYTIQPESIWIKLFADILQERGFFIISYMEVYGSFIELLHKLIYARVKSVLGKTPRDAAWQLFKSKWNLLSHTRSFDSWVMDVLENPYVRLKYFFDPQVLCRKLADAKFSLYSSWPSYTDNLNVYWHKKNLPLEQRLSSNLDFISRSCLSFTLGKKVFLYSLPKESVMQIDDLLLSLVRCVDDLIDNFDLNILEKCINSLNEIKRFFEKEILLGESLRNREDIFQLLECFIKIFTELKTNNFKQLITICNADRVFINCWGMPCHYAVFRKNQLTVNNV